jgi:hypothetical protein
MGIFWSKQMAPMTDYNGLWIMDQQRAVSMQLRTPSRGGDISPELNIPGGDWMVVGARMVFMPIQTNGRLRSATVKTKFKSAGVDWWFVR